MEHWATKVLLPEFKPRQFEYSPHVDGRLVLGTLEGEVIVADHAAEQPIVRAFLGEGELSQDRQDSILGLCWLRHDASRFVVGSSRGKLKMVDFTVEEKPIVQEYDDFAELTSVHVNCTDRWLLASGYTSDVRLYDVGTAQLSRTFSQIHSDHINISRFANLSPNVFATSSFDKSIKMWDERIGSDRAIFTCESDRGHVMLCFSPDDMHLLTSAIDNDVRQYCVADGRLQMKLARRSARENTRADGGVRRPRES